jgi:hypothetical protein
MALQQHYSCCKQHLFFVLLLIVGSCFLLSSKITCAAAHQEAEVEQHQRYSKPRRLRVRSQIYQVIDDPNTNKRGLLNDVLDETSVEFQYKQQRRLKSEIIKKAEKAGYNKEAKSNKASKVYVRKSEKSNEKVGKDVKGQFAKKFQKGGGKSEKEIKGGFAKQYQKRGSKSEKDMNSKIVGLTKKMARQAPSPDTMEGMMSSMSMELSLVDMMSSMSMDIDFSMSM